MRRRRRRSRSSSSTSTSTPPRWARFTPTDVDGPFVIDAVHTRARGLRPVRTEAVEIASFVRRLDWILLGDGLWAIAGITRHDIPTDASYYLVRQGVYAAVGSVGLVALVFVDPDYYRRYKRVIYGGTVSVMLLVLLAGTVSRHSKRWLD